MADSKQTPVHLPVRSAAGRSRLNSLFDGPADLIAGLVIAAVAIREGRGVERPELLRPMPRPNRPAGQPTVATDYGRCHAAHGQ